MMRRTITQSDPCPFVGYFARQQMSGISEPFVGYFRTVISKPFPKCPIRGANIVGKGCVEQFVGAARSFLPLECLGGANWKKCILIMRRDLDLFACNMVSFLSSTEEGA